MEKKKHDPKENLVPFNELTESEQREIARKGGIASGKARRLKRDFKEIAELLLNMRVKKGISANLENISSFAELKGKNLTAAEAITVAVLQNALKGDMVAINYLRDITGQRPAEKVEVEQTIHEGKLSGILKQLEASQKAKENDDD